MTTTKPRRLDRRREDPSRPRRTRQRRFTQGWLDRVGDAAFRGLARLGIGPASLLTTTGRRTGISRNTPVIPVRQGARLWLVAPYGEVSWVLNARAAGQVDLRHGRHTLTYTIREAPATEAGPILKQYVQVASATRPYFLADTTAPVNEFVAEAHLHPVFELIAVPGT
jgi:deazaflavin-dependent oxidoreductase (nitroreductase family)